MYRVFWRVRRLYQGTIKGELLSGDGWVSWGFAYDLCMAEAAAGRPVVMEYAGLPLGMRLP